MTQQDVTTKNRKKAMIDALRKTLGVVTPACDIAGINRITYYRWMEKDAKFREQVRDIDNIALDFAESQLHKQIKNGEVSSTIFYLKTKGKSRGYIEKSEIDHTSGGQSLPPVIINIQPLKEDENFPSSEDELEGVKES